MSQTTSRGSFDSDQSLRSSFACRKHVHVTYQPAKATSTRSVAAPHCFMALRRTVICCDVLRTIAGAGWTLEETRILISVRDQADIQAYLDGVAQNLHVCEQIVSLLCFQRIRKYFIQRNTTRAAITFTEDIFIPRWIMYTRYSHEFRKCEHNQCVFDRDSTNANCNPDRV